MSKLSTYDIAYRGLEEGTHEFDFKVDAEFFEHFKEGLIEVANIDVKVFFEKRSSFLKLTFKLKGTIELMCDRCLDNYNQRIKHKDEVFVKFGDGIFEEGDDVFWVSPDEYHINIAQLIYEYAALSIPMKHVHPKDESGKRACNKTMIKQLKSFSHHENEPEQTDKRWDALKNLKNNNLK